MAHGCAHEEATPAPPVSDWPSPARVHSRALLAAAIETARTEQVEPVAGRELVRAALRVSMSCFEASHAVEAASRVRRIEDCRSALASVAGWIEEGRAAGRLPERRAAEITRLCDRTVTALARG